MATKKSNPPNHTAARRRLDTIDSLHPSSLPPELGSLDMSWDDDPRSVGAIDLLQNADLDLDMDAGERTTAIPDIPIEQLVQATMAEADARELAQDAQESGRPMQPEPWLDAPSATTNEMPLPAGGVEERRFGPDIRNPGPTQPAPSRAGAPQQRDQLPTLTNEDPVGDAQHWTEATKPPSSQRDRQRLLSSNPPLTSRSMAGPVGPSSSRPPALLENRFSAPPTVRRTETDGLRHQMKDRYATGDFSGALQLAEALLEADDGDLEAQRFATSCRDILTQMLASRVGSFEQVVEVALTPEELRWLTLDHRAGFFLSLVDSSSTIDELLDISGMPRLESLRILSTLIEQRVLRLVPH